jgi:Uma2 family endonuclease
LLEGGESDEDILTVVQPDFTIICNYDKLDKRGCKGNPDLVVEIVSPFSGGKVLFFFL